MSKGILIWLLVVGVFAGGLMLNTYSIKQSQCEIPECC